MYNWRSHSKIKNAKILRWRVELSQYRYEIVYRAGKLNVAPDTLSRVYCASVSESTLYDIHSALCHPGITRTFHFVKSKNLPYSLDDVRKMISACKVCGEIKPRFHKPPFIPLIKATQPMERLSVDFKGPLPSRSKHKYVLTVVDEYSRYPFSFPCSNVNAKTVIACSSQIFTLFGACGYVHSDRAKTFLSNELVSYLHSMRRATSNTSAYNPRGNGQCEKYNDIIWSAVQLALKTRNLPISEWESVLPQVLHSIRSLLCTSTNTTPHERFLGFQRRSAVGVSVPSWLASPGPVLVKRHVRASKYDPSVEEAELIHAIPSYAHIRFRNGHETKVSLRDVAPLVGKESISNKNDEVDLNLENKHSNFSNSSDRSFDSEVNASDSDAPSSSKSPAKDSLVENPLTNDSSHSTNESAPLRRSTRIRNAPDRLMYYS